MKTKILLFLAIMSMTLTFAQTSKSEINKIIREQSDGIITPAQKGVTTVYQDGTSVVKTVYKDIKSLSPKVESAIKSLATELKTTTDALWVILVKQQLVWSICFLILTLTSLFNWYIFYNRYLNNNLTEKDFVKGEKIIYEKIKNPDYSSYANSNDNRSKLYINKGEIKEEILIPIENPNNSSFKYLHLTICIGLSGLSIYHFSDMLTGFINPSYGALKTIVQVAHSLK